MGKTVKVPDPVYKEVTRQANREDVSRGTIIRDWMEKADKYERMEARKR